MVIESWREKTAIRKKTEENSSKCYVKRYGKNQDWKSDDT